MQRMNACPGLCKLAGSICLELVFQDLAVVYATNVRAKQYAAYKRAFECVVKKVRVDVLQRALGCGMSAVALYRNFLPTELGRNC